MNLLDFFTDWSSVPTAASFSSTFSARLTASSCTASALMSALLFADIISVTDASSNLTPSINACLSFISFSSPPRLSLSATMACIFDATFSMA